MAFMSKDECLVRLLPALEQARKKAALEKRIAGEITLNRHIADQHADAMDRQWKAETAVLWLESLKHHLETP